MAVATENISEMVRLIQKYIGPSVPRIEAEAAIYAAANEIENWNVAKEEKRTIDITQGSDIILISPAVAEYSLNSVTYLAYRDRPMTPKTEQWLDDNDPYWRHSEEGEPLFYFVEKISKDDDNIIVRTSRKPAETVTDGYTFVAACKSRPETITSVDNLILTWYRLYGELLEFGAAGRILMQPKRKWSNPTLGKYYLTKFNQLKQELISESRRSHVGASVSVQQRNWV